VSLNSVLDVGEWLTSGADRFNPREKDPGSHWIRGCVSPRSGVDAVVKSKFPHVYRESNPGRSAHNSVTILTELSRIDSIIFRNNFTLLFKK